MSVFTIFISTENQHRTLSIDYTCTYILGNFVTRETFYHCMLKKCKICRYDEKQMPEKFFVSFNIVELS